MRTERWIQSQRQMEMMREKERPSPGQAQGHRNRLTRTFFWTELHEKTATNRRRVTERARERNQEASKSRDSRQMRPFSFIHLSIHSFIQQMFVELYSGSLGAGDPRGTPGPLPTSALT